MSIICSPLCFVDKSSFCFLSFTRQVFTGTIIKCLIHSFHKHDILKYIPYFIVYVNVDMNQQYFLFIFYQLQVHLFDNYIFVVTICMEYLCVNGNKEY